MVRIAPHITWNNVEGDLALFDLRDGRYHALNGSAAEIWRAIAEDLPMDAIIARLARHYSAEPDRITADTDAFVHAAIASGLLERSGETG